MKLKRFLALAVIACVAFAAATFAPSFVPTKASAAETVTKLAGYDYTTEYILREFGLEKIGGNSTLTGGRTVKYRLVKDGETDVAANTAEYAESTEITAGSTVKFLRANCTYKFTVTADGTDTEYFVETVDADAITEIATVYSETALSAENQAAMNEYAATLKTSSTFKFSELKDKTPLAKIVSNKYFDVTSMKVTVHYYVPGASSWSTTTATTISGASFSTTKVGEYAFYFTFTDPLNNADDTSELVMGNNGFWTDADEDGEIDYANDEFVIPVFHFTVGESSKPEVSVTVSEKAFLDLEYKIDAFNITATDYSTKYTLYFIPEGATGAYVDKTSDAYDIENKGDVDYIAAVTGNTSVKDVTDILDVSTLKFTPTEKGYYYAKLLIYNNSGYSDEIMSYAIACLDEYKEVVPETQFFKYNVTSIVFLSISAVCFIGIIVVLLIKPKNTKDLEVKGDADKKDEKKSK